METTIHEESPVIEVEDQEDENRPLSTEDKVLLAKALGSVIIVGAAAIYGASVAGFQAGRFVMIKIQTYRAKKKEDSDN